MADRQRGLRARRHSGEPVLRPAHRDADAGGRTGTPARVVRYAPRWERVCVRHGRWQLDADADQPLEHLDLRGVPEVAAAQRRWAGVARRAVPAGAEPEEVLALAHAVVARWWEQALHW